MGAAVVAAALSFNAPAALAKPGPVSTVIKHGIYEAIVVCPRWNGPAGGPAPLLAAPRQVNPTPARNVPQPQYAPLVTCTVTFLKDGPAPRPEDKEKGPGKACSPVGALLSAQLPARIARFSRAGRHHDMRFTSSCVLIETGFGGMARHVSRHEPGARRHR